jgi:hypothetical protein
MLLAQKKTARMWRLPEYEADQGMREQLRPLHAQIQQNRALADPQYGFGGLRPLSIHPAEFHDRLR